MADPTVVQNVNGTSALASTVATFSVAGAGNLLILAWAGDDYRSGTPSGWTQVAAEQQTFHGLNVFYKIAAGGETSVTYVIGSAARSAWKVIEFDSVASFGNGLGTFTQASASTQATPTLTPAAGRKLIVAVTGWSTTSVVTAFSSVTWATISLTSGGASAGPNTNPQEMVGLGWTVADYTGSNTVASTGSSNTTAQARSAIIGSFAVSTGGSGAPPPQPNIVQGAAMVRSANW